MAGAFFAQIKRRAAAISAGLGEYYHAPYRATFRRAAREEDDLFDLLVALRAARYSQPGQLLHP